MFEFIGCQSAVRFATLSEAKKETRNIVKVDSEKDRSDNYTRLKKNIEPLKIDKNLDSEQRQLIEEAQKYIGSPYCYGGSGADCIDCSGLVQIVYSSIGLSMPRTASDQYLICKKIDETNVKAGDLVFFGSKNVISHVGIFVGDNQIIHASSSKGVILQSLDDPYLSSKFNSYGRILNNY